MVSGPSGGRAFPERALFLRGGGALLLRQLDGALHEQDLRAPAVGRRFFRIRSVRQQDACLDGVRQHGIQNFVEPAANFRAANGTGDLHAADGIARHHVGRRDIDVPLLAAAEAEDAECSKKRPTMLVTVMLSVARHAGGEAADAADDELTRTPACEARDRAWMTSISVRELNFIRM